jgi:hypothetical protein
MSVGNKVRPSNCERCGTAIDTRVSQDGTAKCDICTSLDRAPSVRSTSGRILRHWTTNDLVFMGKATTTASEVGDWGLADARRLNLIASKLKSLAGRAGAL